MHIVISALVEIGGKPLVCLRGAGEFPFTWEFPCVELAEGETLDDAIQKHMFSELGLTISFNKIIDKFEAQILGETYIFYLVQLVARGGNFTLGMYQDAALASKQKLSFWKLSPITHKHLSHIL